MKGDGAARIAQRAFGVELRKAVRNHCYRTRAPDYHYDQCLADLRKEPPEWWPWFLQLFKGEIK